MPNDLIGHSIGQYHIIKQLGEGGMATVYKAYDTRGDREVAVKIIRSDLFGTTVLKRIYKRFEREAQSLEKLSHPNIVSVIEYGEHDGSPFIVMEYIPSGTLKQKLGKPILWTEAFRIIVPIAQALDYAHKNKIIHRDVKPSNILITESGQPKLTDFGIAKILESDEGVTLATTTGVGIGTPEYMAPEQGMGHEVDASADIYSLGIVLYELITGKKPFRADTPMAVVVKHVNDPLPRPSQFVSNLPKELEQILFKALAKSPEDRYRSMQEFANALERIQKVVKEAAKEKANKPQEKKRKPAPIKLSRRWVGFLGGSATLFLAIWLGLPKIRILASLEPTITATIQVQASPTESFVETITPTLTPTKVVTPFPTNIPSKLTDVKGVSMVLVSAGKFWMGGDGIGGFFDEQPAHQIYLDAFYIDRYEVTNVLYKACVDTGTCDPPTSTSHYNSSQYAQHPVVNVNWYMAKEYCEWRGGRLPTEAEWEKAARGTDSRYYPWGNYNDIDCLDANFYDALNIVYCVGDTKPVGSYYRGYSPYGAYDMAGNVWEWAADWYSSDYYASSPASNPLGPDNGGNRVLRGGSWSSPPHDIGTANRDGSDPLKANNTIGFRCAMDVP